MVHLSQQHVPHADDPARGRQGVSPQAAPTYALGAHVLKFSRRPGPGEDSGRLERAFVLAAEAARRLGAGGEDAFAVRLLRSAINEIEKARPVRAHSTISTDNHQHRTQEERR